MTRGDAWSLSVVLGGPRVDAMGVAALLSWLLVGVGVERSVRIRPGDAAPPLVTAAYRLADPGLLPAMCSGVAL